MLRSIKSLRTALKSHKITVYICSVGFLALIAIFAFSTGVKPPARNSIINNDNTTQQDSAARPYVPGPAIITEAEAGRIHTYAENWYNDFLGSKGFNGGMIVAKSGNIVFEKYKGTVHIPGNDDINENTSLQIASTSKTFTAMSVLKLWQEGKLNINDPLTKYFPNFNYPGVTIKTLLDHRSGLPNYLYGMAEKGWDQRKYAHNQDVLDWCIKYKNSLEDVTPADKHFRYCNTNYVLLALIVEKVTGISFPQYVTQTFFVPLGMEHTFVFNPETNPNGAPSYTGKTRVKWNYLDAVYGDKNVYTTPRDLLKWDRALSVGNLFTPATLAAAYTPNSNESRGMKNYGLGWRMNIYPNGKKMIYHNGWWHGSNCAFIRLIQDTATIIIISNKYNSNVYKAKKLAPVFGDYMSGNDVDDNENPDTFGTPQRVVRHNRRSAVKRVPHAAVKRRRRK